MPEIPTNLQSKTPSFFEKFQGDVIAVETTQGDSSVVVPAAKIREMVRFLKDQSQPKFETLMDLFGMDYLKSDPEPVERFAVIYIFYSYVTYEHFRLKVYLSETNPVIDSVHDIYVSANWNEREAWDLFGVTFTGHPNLARLLCHTEFVGHPLRKDYPADQYQRLKIASPSTGF